MEIREKIINYLTENKISYKPIKHKAAESAEKYHNILGTRYEQQAKALLIRYKKAGEKGFVVVTLQGHKTASLERVKDLLGAKSVRLAEPNQLKEETGCKFGELPPFGKLFGFKLLMDKDFLQEPEIYFNAGSLGDSIIISGKDLAELENPILF